MATETRPCCPGAYPETWNNKEISWQEKLLVKGRVRSIFHMPLSFGSVLRKLVRLIDSAGAMPEEMLVVSDENSLWGSDMYIAVTKDLPQAQMAWLSGTFLTKVLEGPHRQVPAWFEEMKRYVTSKGRESKHLYFLYKTCPKCAKKYGKNYIVLLAQI